MKKFFAEFKKFIARGNVMDMAVGIIIGGAFTGIVNSLVNDIINPFLGLFGGMNFDQYVLVVNGAEIAYGRFITAIINFLIMALIIFCIVNFVNNTAKRFEKKQEEKVTTKECPFCKSKIAIEAVRCPHCTSMLEK